MRVVLANTRVLIQLELEDEDKAEIAAILSRNGVPFHKVQQIRDELAYWFEYEFNRHRIADPKYGQVMK